MVMKIGYIFSRAICPYCLRYVGNTDPMVKKMRCYYCKRFFKTNWDEIIKEASSRIYHFGMNGEPKETNTEQLKS